MQHTCLLPAKANHPLFRTFPNLVPGTRNMQIEHVWPQIPPDSDYGNWRPELKEKHSKIVDLLGNLILLDQSWSASLSNRLPCQKRDEK